MKPLEQVLYVPSAGRSADVFVVSSGAVSYLRGRVYTAPKVAAQILVGGEWWPLSQVPRDAAGEPADVVPLRLSDVADRNWSRYPQPYTRRTWLRKYSSRADFIIPAFGPWPNNFYHWLIEILPRIFFSLQVVPSDASVEIIVSKDVAIDASFLEVLEYVVHRSVRVRTVARPVKFCRAMVSDTFVGSVTFQAVDVSKGGPDTGIQNQAFLDFQRALLQGLEQARGASFASWGPIQPRSVFLDRGPSARRPFNRAEVLGVMESIGVQIVRPHEMSKLSLGSILSGARVVIGPHGAGLTNIVFCQNLEKLIVLTPETHVRQGAMWSNLSSAQGATTVFVSGPAVRDYTDADQRPHTYDVSDILLAMEIK